MIHVDTSFLVDFLRETGRRETGPATSFLEAHPADTLGVSVFVLCELAAGAELARDPVRERERVARIVQSLESVQPGDRFPSIYGRLLARLQRGGARVATMDLLIAAAALEADAPLLTRNRKDFEKVPGLEVIPY